MQAGQLLHLFAGAELAFVLVVAVELVPVPAGWEVLVNAAAVAASSQTAFD